METYTLPTEASNTPVPRSKRINQIIIFGAIAYLLHALFIYSLEKQPELLKTGETVPHFSVGLADGGMLSEMDIIGKPAMIFYFANWCPCSHESIKWIKEAKSQYSSMGLTVVGIGIQDTTANISEFAAKHALDFPVGIKGGDSAARIMGIKTTPTTLFFDSSGVLRHSWVGKIEEQGQIQEGINSIYPKEQFAVAR
ncbi:MAG: TlpA family protein disulfide reductase [Nitrospinota bacterium]|nr:TlpA family protein disulfide reductase [Nitrospinota bacterium]